MRNVRSGWCRAAAACLVVVATPALADNKYDPGASDTEITIGNVAPYSGAGSAWSVTAKTIDAYFKKVNTQGGVNGRRIRFISYDDGFNPAKTVEQTRKLVESDQVLFMFQTLGTSHNLAIQKYLNTRKIPQLFISTPATQFDDPRNFPWTMRYNPSCQAEGRALAAYLLEKHPGARIGVLVQNDDYGRDCVKGLKDGLGPRASTMIVADHRYEITDPTIDSQIIACKAAGADVFFDVSTPKHTTQAIRKIHEIGWHPLHLVSSSSASLSILKTAGLEISKGIVTTSYGKNPDDAEFKDDPDVRAWRAFMDEFFPNRDRSVVDGANVYGYMVANLMVHVLKQCGNDLTRANVMRQAASLKDVEIPLLLPGTKINTSADDYAPIKQLRLRQFDGERYVTLRALTAPDVRR